MCLKRRGVCVICSKERKIGMEAKGGEVRRLHIVYFLSCMGHIEQPHLIKIHHLARNGVYLRDVKRWLGELRGKDTAEAFSWSYKRRYKTGYVWQDLLDDDLITPISDNEYVLKGSQIHPTHFETHLFGEKKASILPEEISTQVQVTDGKQQKQQPLAEEPQIQRYPDLKPKTEEKWSSEISQESIIFSFDSSTRTDENDSSKVEEEKRLSRTGKQNPDERSHEKLENYSLHSLYQSLLNKKSRNQSNRYNMEKTATPDTSFSTLSSSSSSSQSSIKESKRYSTGASGVFRSLITCGALDTNDAVLVMNRADKDVSKNSNDKFHNKAQLCKEDKFGGSARSFGSCWNIQQQQQQQCPARKSCDEKGTNKNKKKLGELMNQTPHKQFGGAIRYK